MAKIAIIEDDPVINQMYRMKFESEGFDVQVANNGQTGVDMVKAFSPDLVLMDLQMPQMDGAEALRLIREQPEHKEVPVMILTNLGEEEAPKELRKLGIHSYIVKADLTPKQVVERARAALGSS